MITENQPWQPPENSEHQCQLTDRQIL